MRQLLFGLLFCFCGTCLNTACMKDSARPFVPTYEGESIIKIRRAWPFYASATIEDRTNSELEFSEFVYDPKTHSFSIKGLKRKADVAPGMKAFVDEQGKVVEGMPYQVAYAEVQGRTAVEIAREIRGGITDGMTVAAQMMGLRNERAVQHSAASAANPDILEQLVQQYLPQIVGSAATQGGYNADLNQVKADQFVALARAKQLQAQNPQDPNVNSLVQTLETALNRCCQFKNATRQDPLAVPGLP